MIKKKQHNLFFFRKVVTFLVIDIFILWIGLHNIGQLDMPIIEPDEFGYWANAATLCGYDWSGLAASYCNYYGLGMSFFLAFFIIIFQQMEVVYRVVILSNVFLLVISFHLLCKIIPIILHNISDNAVSLISFLLVLYPSIQQNTQFAWSETYLYFFYILGLYFFSRFLVSKKLCNALIFELLMIFLFYLHQRAVLLSLFALGILILFIWTRKDDHVLRNLSIILLISIICFFAYFLMKGYLEEHLWNNYSNILYIEESNNAKAADANDFAGQIIKIQKMISVKGIKNLAIGVLGKIWYMGVCSCGIGILGLGYCIKIMFGQLRKSGRYFDNETVWICFVGGAYLLMLATSSLYFIEPVRIDMVIYGRYSDWVVIPLLLIGVGRIRVLTQRGIIYKYVGMISVVLLSIALVIQKYIESQKLTIYNQFNSPLCTWFYDKGRESNQWIFFMTLFVIFIICIVTILIATGSGMHIKRQYAWITSSIIVAVIWINGTDYNVKQELQLGKKAEVREIYAEVGKTNKDLIYIIDKEVGISQYAYTLQFLMKERPIEIIIVDMNSALEPVDENKLILSQVTSDVMGRGTVVKKNEIFVLSEY